MESKWPLKSLEELGVQLLDCVHQTPKEQDTGMPYIGIPQMKNGEIDFKASPRIISQEDFLKWTEKVNPSHGDIILSRRCNPGETAFVPQNAQFALGQNLVLLRPDPKKLHPGYLRWVVQSPFWWDEVERYRNPGAVFDSLKCADIPKFLVPEPPREIQESLDRVLLAIAEKITLNRQINQTLEQMAQTLFKSWFVDFDPVIDNALDAGNDIPDTLQERAEQRRLLRAKADFKSLPAETRALFPSEFEETELGWVPKGWTVRSAEEIAEISIGKTPPRAETHWFSENSLQNIPWVSIKDMGTCGVFTNGSSEYLVPEGVDKFNVKLVPKDSIILSFKLTLGRVAITNERLTTNEAIAHFINPKFGLSKEFIYCYLMDFNFDLLGSTSSIATAVNSKIIKMMPFLVPKFDVTKHYTETVRNIFEKIKMTSDEINVLVQLRDSLLPKLISGELALDDLPEEIAEAAEAV